MWQEENARITREAMDAFVKRDGERFQSYLSDDVTFTFPGTSPLSGVHRGKESVGRWLQAVKALYPKGLAYTVEHILSSEAMGAAFWSNRGVDHKGQDYRNSGVVAFEVHNGQITAIRIHLDTEAIKRVF